MYISHVIQLTITVSTLLSCLFIGVEGSISLDEDHRDDYGHYTNDYVMEINGDGLVADLIAGAHNLRLVKHLDTLGNIYHFIHDETPARAKRSADNFLGKLRKDPNVVFVDQQQILHRVKRPAINRAKREIVYDKQIELDSPLVSKSNSQAILDYYFGKGNKRGGQQCTKKENIKRGLFDFDDPCFCLQWYLMNTGEVQGVKGNDVGVVEAWKLGFSGKGVVVSVLDDGVDHNHPDLKKNYDPEASLDLNDNDDDPAPNEKGVSKMANAHGTRCAGEIAAGANNGVCGVGVAYNAKIGGVRMLDGRVTDVLEFKALSHASDHIDIYSASWGPRDDGATMEGPNNLAKKALKDGAEKGRNGLGSIFSWATGNGGENDDCNCDGYVSDIHTISIGCINDMAMSTYFSEICTSTMAVIYTGGSHAKPGEAAYNHPSLSIITTDLEGGCNLDFEGTSSAAPLAAGVFALVLEANPKITWRDLQYVIADTAMVPNPNEPDWTINAAGYHVNPRFGFGALVASKMVERVMNDKWVTVNEHHECNVTADNDPISIQKGATISQTLTTKGCQSNDKNAVELLEHTQVHVKIKTACRGCLSIKLESAGGTVSELLSLRPNDKFNQAFEWTFMTVHNWGENPRGMWKLSITDNGEHSSDDAGELIKWSMTFYGMVGPNPNTNQTENRQVVKNKNNSNKQHKAYEANPNEIAQIMEGEKAERKDTSEIVETEVSDNQDIGKDKIKDLTELAKLVLNKDDYTVVRDYLLRGNDKKDEELADDNDSYWERVYDRELKNKFEENLGINDEGRGYIDSQNSGKVNKNDQQRYNIDTDDNYYKLNNYNDNGENLNEYKVGNDHYRKNIVENNVSDDNENSKREQMEYDDIEETINLIKDIMEKLKDNK